MAKNAILDPVIGRINEIDRLAQIFKKSIDEACTNHKITI